MKSSNRFPPVPTGSRNRFGAPVPRFPTPKGNRYRRHAPGTTQTTIPTGTGYCISLHDQERGQMIRQLAVRDAL